MTERKNHILFKRSKYSNFFKNLLNIEYENVAPKSAIRYNRLLPIIFNPTTPEHVPQIPSPATITCVQCGKKCNVKIVARENNSQSTDHCPIWTHW